MAKRGRKSKTESGEQLDLIDVKPENSKKIIACAKRYKTAQADRIAALQVETEEKEALLALIKEANLQHLEDGRIKFKIDGMTITVTPRNELIKVKEDGENED